MKSHVIVTTLMLACTAGLVQAQVAQPSPRTAPGRANLRNQLPKPVNVPFEPMWKKDEQGKVLPIDGHYDLHALRNNPTVSDETLAKCESGIREWLAEVDRVTIDNLDFLEKLEGGLLDNFKLSDAGQIRVISEMMQQLMSAGNANRFLNEKGLLDMQQIGVSQQIINDYQQQRMQEVRPAGVNQQSLPKEEQEKMAADVSRLLYRMSANDTFVAYHRLINEASTKLGGVIDGLDAPADAKAKAQAAFSEVSKAGDAPAKASATKAALAALPFDARRSALEKIAASRGSWDVWQGLPARPANITANQRPAPSAAENSPDKR